MTKSRVYKLAEACRILDLQPYVLRYWETEFPALRSDAKVAGQRVFNDPEIALLRRIKQLLYDEGYTIAGAKKKIDSEAAGIVAAAEGGDASIFDPTPAVAIEVLEPATVSSRTESASAVRPKVSAPPSSTAPTAGTAKSRSAKKRESVALDTAPSDRIETLRRGIGEALREARELLSRIDESAH